MNARATNDKPLQVILQKEAAGYSAINLTFGLSGFGETEDEAFECLAACVRTTFSAIAKKLCDDPQFIRKIVDIKPS